MSITQKIQQEITGKILAEMETGNLPWVKPWSGKGLNNMPRNGVSKRAYSGVNVLLLWLAAEKFGYASNKWLTYKQAVELGGNVRKGEKATQIIYYSTFEKENSKGDIDNIPFLKTFNVFSAEQCENLDALQEPPLVINQEKRNADCEAFFISTKAEIQNFGGRAYYAAKEDKIVLPPYETFNSANGYYATGLHELVHWSGNEKRCNREFGKRFGDKAYAAEELVAELGAAFMCAEFGFDAITQHAAYIQHWIDLLKDDSKAFFTAASKASQATEYLRGLALADTEQLTEQLAA